MMALTDNFDDFCDWDQVSPMFEDQIETLFKARSEQHADPFDPIFSDKLTSGISISSPLSTCSSSDPMEQFRSVGETSSAANRSFSSQGSNDDEDADNFQEWMDMGEGINQHDPMSGLPLDEIQPQAFFESDLAVGGDEIPSPGEDALNDAADPIEAAKQRARAVRHSVLDEEKAKRKCALSSYRRGEMKKLRKTHTNRSCARAHRLEEDAYLKDLINIVAMLEKKIDHLSQNKPV